jgi:PST family polysaccharide transporter
MSQEETGEKRNWTFLNSRLLKIFISSGSTTGIKILSAVILAKVIAVRLGPSGLAMIGQLSNFVSIALLLSTAGLGNGIIKYVAESKSTEEREEFIRQSFKLTVIVALCLSLVLMVACRPLSVLCFDTSEYSFVFLLLGLSIVLYAIHNYFISLLNGLGAYRVFNRINAITSVFGLAISVVLIYFFGLGGAFTAIAINQTISCMISFFFTRKYIPLFRDIKTVQLKKAWLLRLFSFSMMAFVTAFVAPSMQLFVRNLLIDKVSLTSAGEWEAINRISILYLTVILNVMLIYYLPLLSAINSSSSLRAEIRKGYKFFLPIVILLAIGVFGFRDIIIKVLLSDEFIEIRRFFVPQLIGDAFKILSFLYAYLIIAKVLIRMYIGLEIFTGLLYIILSDLLVSRFGAIGAIYSYTVTYFFYFLFLAIYCEFFYLRNREDTVR